MSAALVRKSLALVDDTCDDIQSKRSRKDRKTGKSILRLIPENHKITQKVKQKGRRGEKVNLLSTSKKLTVAEAKRTHKSKEQIIEENIKKLKLIKAACTIDLDKHITSRIIERAVTRRPIQSTEKSKKVQKTAFTEEDFKKFEAEYFDEDY